jgi:hypothetical protein
MKTMILSLLLGLSGVAGLAYVLGNRPAVEPTAARVVKSGRKSSKAPPGMEQFRRCAAGLSRDCAGADALAAGMFEEDGALAAEVPPAKSRRADYKDASRVERAEFLPFDPAAVAIALEQATLDGACRRGSQKSCSALKKLSGSTQTLRKLALLTKTDCGRRRLEACRLRGDFAWAAGDHAEARAWYDKGRRIAQGESQRCALGKLSDANRCREAALALSHFDQRSDELSKRMLPAH